jgi:hypothetical protein
VKQVNDSKSYMSITKKKKLVCLIIFLQERPPPVPTSRPYTVTGNKKIAFPQSRVMKNSFPGKFYGWKHG